MYHLASIIIKQFIINTRVKFNYGTKYIHALSVNLIALVVCYVQTEVLQHCLRKDYQLTKLISRSTIYNIMTFRFYCDYHIMSDAHMQVINFTPVGHTMKLTQH